MERLLIRDALEADLPFIVGLIASDPIAAARDPERPGDAAAQMEGFCAIAADPNHRLLVAELAETPVGSFQLSFIPGVARGGAWRGQIEAVRVAPAHHGQGIGEAMMRWAIEHCKDRGCALVQLTSDHNRPDAHRFYERLGFAATHSGFKLKLG